MFLTRQLGKKEDREEVWRCKMWKQNFGKRYHQTAIGAAGIRFSLKEIKIGES